MLVNLSPYGVHKPAIKHLTAMVVVEDLGVPSVEVISMEKLPLINKKEMQSITTNNFSSNRFPLNGLIKKDLWVENKISIQH